MLPIISLALSSSSLPLAIVLKKYLTISYLTSSSSVREDQKRVEGKRGKGKGKGEEEEQEREEVRWRGVRIYLVICILVQCSSEIAKLTKYPLKFEAFKKKKKSCYAFVLWLM